MSKISLIIPIFNEEESIPYLYERVKAIRKNILPDELEILFIDDSSTDNSFNLLYDISRHDRQVKIIRFSKNFGSHIACLAGIVNSDGDACAFISADLQDPPELLPALISKWKGGDEIVFGVRDKEREDNIIIKLFSRIFFFLMKKFALKNMPERGMDVFLIDKKIVDVIKGIKEKNPNIFGLILWTGFKYTEVAYKKEARQRGKSKWTFSKKIKILIDSFVAFSFFPIRLISSVGFLMAFLGFIYACVVVVNRLFFAKPIEGWASLMVVLLVVSGVQMVMLGILGEYLWRNFDESRNRPPFIVSEKIGFDKEKITP